jgi:hypothetical protein
LREKGLGSSDYIKEPNMNSNWFAIVLLVLCAALLLAFHLGGEFADANNWRL